MQTNRDMATKKVKALRERPVKSFLKGAQKKGFDISPPKEQRKRAKKCPQGGLGALTVPAELLLLTAPNTSMQSLKC